MEDPAKLIEATLAEFRFKYIGGGYFRDKTVPLGKRAEILHGDEVLKEFVQALTKAFKER